MPPTYTDEEFIDAVDGTTSTHRVADRVGCTNETAHRRLYDLALDEKVGFMHAPEYRDSERDTLVVDADMMEQGLHYPPEKWREPRDA
jgi:hypothetical protein